MGKSAYVGFFLLILGLMIVAAFPASADSGIAIPKIDVAPKSLPVDGTVTFTIYGQLVDEITGNPHILDPYLTKVRVEYINVYDANRPDPVIYSLGSLYRPVEIPKGSSWSITFGTNAPDKSKWEPESSTSSQSPPSYVVDFNGYFYTSEGGGRATPWGYEFWFDIPEHFGIPELSIIIAVVDAAPLLFGLKRLMTKK